MFIYADMDELHNVDFANDHSILSLSLPFFSEIHIVIIYVDMYELHNVDFANYHSILSLSFPSFIEIYIINLYDNSRII